MRVRNGLHRTGYNDPPSPSSPYATAKNDDDDDDEMNVNLKYSNNNRFILILELGDVNELHLLIIAALPLNTTHCTWFQSR